MNADLLNEIKDYVYEAEGLLELLRLRDDKDADLLPLVKARLQQALALIPEVVELPEPELETRGQETRPLPAFCLNDRFKFKRSLFNGSEEEFRKALEAVATLDSFEEAEEYLYSLPGFDPENEDVMDFMELMRNYFSS